ncbi:NUDIX domain-containing protein [bacterium]|nr:MAG: NUDIX domain-containing protein [bacterium]
MRLIGFADDNDSKSQKLPEWLGGWNARIAVRGVLTDSDGKIALMHLKKHNVYKLPGGGVEQGESLMEAFSRELLEETGCKTELGEEIGVFLEKRDNWKLFQISFSYLAKALEKGELALTEEEKSYGFSLVWADDINGAIKLMSENYSNEEDCEPMLLRDLNILRSAKQVLEKK